LPAEYWRRTVAESDAEEGRLLLAALDAGGEVLGYAKSGEHKSRPAYASTCETSVYVARDARGRGVGGALYDALLARLDESPLRLAVGGVAEPNEASTRLHLSRGFTPVGTFTGVGAKRGRAWDVTWYQRPLAAPRLVEELRGVTTVPEAERAMRGRYPDARIGAPETGAVPILDPNTARRLGSIDVAGPLSGADRLLLEWCAEALAPLYATRRSRGLSG
jgi:phosphinothricin acetyltransferase